MATTAVLRDIHDFKIGRVTEDSASAYTVSTLVDLPGVTQFSQGLEFDTDELRGDGVIKDSFSKIDKITGSFAGCVDLDVLQTILGGNRFSPAGSEEFRFTPDFAPYVFFEAKTLSHVGGLDYHFRVFKARITNFSAEQTEQTYMNFTADYEAIPTTFVWTDDGPPITTGNYFFSAQLYDTDTATADPSDTAS